MIRIITDSTCDLSQERQKALGVEVAPLLVHFGEESFRDGVELSNHDFYQRLRSAQASPSTSQVNPDDFAHRFQTHVDNGDEIVGIFIASQLSGTYQSAVIAKEMVDAGEIHLVDSGTVTFGLGLLVEAAARFRDQGMSAQEIAQEVGKLVPRVRLFAVVETLKYLKMGGRISATSAVVGGILGVTPILRIQDGVVEAAGKVRGRKHAYPWMEERMADQPVDTSLPIAFGHADATQALEECKAYFLPKLGEVSYEEYGIGSVVGTHAGPGCAGIAYFVSEK